MVPAADVVLVADGIDLLHLAEQVAQIINIMQVQIEQASAAVFGTAIPLAPGGMLRKAAGTGLLNRSQSPCFYHFLGPDVFRPETDDLSHGKLNTGLFGSGNHTVK